MISCIKSSFCSEADRDILDSICLPKNITIKKRGGSCFLILWIKNTHWRAYVNSRYCVPVLKQAIPHTNGSVRVYRYFIRAVLIILSLVSLVYHLRNMIQKWQFGLLVSQTGLFGLITGVSWVYQWYRFWTPDQCCISDTAIDCCVSCYQCQLKIFISIGMKHTILQNS